MTLREKLMHYTHDLGCGVDLKQEAIATIEHIAQYMDEDELMHHSRPLALAYLALTEDDSVPVTRCKDCEKSGVTELGKRYCKEPMGSFFGCIPVEDDYFCSGGRRKDGGNG